MAQLFTNNAAATLAFGITAGATTCTVASGKGALFPSPSGGDYAILTLTQAGATETSWEEVYLTERSGDLLTISRGCEESTAAAWSAGSKIELRITAQALTEMASAVSAVAPVPGLVVDMAKYHPPVKHISATSYNIVTADNHSIIVLDASFTTVGISDWLPNGAKVTLVNNTQSSANITLFSSWSLFVVGNAYRVNSVTIPPRGAVDLFNVGEPNGWPNWIASGTGLTYA